MRKAKRRTLQLNAQLAQTLTEKGVEASSDETTTALVDKVAEISGSDTKEIENLIDESGVLEDTEGTVTEKVEQLIDKAEEEKIWYARSKEWTFQFKELFGKTTMKTIPEMNFENATSLRYFATAASIETIDYYINSGKATDFFQAFTFAENLKFVYGIDFSNGTVLYEVFKFCSSLETIQEPLNLSKNTSDISGMFIGCPSLKNIRFIKESIYQTINFTACPLLSAESIQSIIDGLVDLTETDAKPLIFHNDVKVKLTEEQIATITGKNWTLA